MYRAPPYSRSVSRSRPYADPYHSFTEGRDDDISELSPWSVDEQVQAILQDGTSVYTVCSKQFTFL